VTARVKLLRSSTFRLAALYLALFVLSVGALLGYVYWNTAVLLERQTDETIRTEVQALADQYRLRGLNGIIDTIRRRSSDDSGAVYLLTSPSGERVAGNLDNLPAIPRDDANWIEFPLKVEKGQLSENHVARAFYTQLAGGFELVVGRDVAALRHSPDHLLCAGHRPGAGTRRRLAHEPQFPEAGRRHHRGEPFHHGGQHGRAHAGGRFQRRTRPAGAGSQ
jgi:hypothetical protein